MYLKFFKPFFDFISAVVVLILLFPFLLIVYFVLFFNYRGKPLFLQYRIGKLGDKFLIYKLRTMDDQGNISRFSGFLRKLKIDELPQLFNIIKGEMSVVGPRPDLPGYYDKLEGEDRLILQLKPGLTGYASLKFYNEEAILAKETNPDSYNDEILFPEKVKLNLWYYKNISFLLDLKIILKTLLLPFKK